MFGGDRVWLLTWTTYGTWLPGDERGFISRVVAGPGPRVEHDQPLTPYDVDMPGLLRSARSKLKSPPIHLTADHAATLLAQFQETVRHRCWNLLATAVMTNHVHVLAGVPGDPAPENLLRDFKSYGSRALNSRCPKPASGTWWTESGSKRKKADKAVVRAAICYIRDQANPLMVWLSEEAQQYLEGERGA